MVPEQRKWSAQKSAVRMGEAAPCALSKNERTKLDNFA
jgi:hypothetical protein